MHVVEAGPVAGRPVVLVHGFPETWWSWRHQMPALASAGFRAIAFDLRGYNRSDKPRGLSAYRLDRLAGDLRAVLDDAAREPVAVVAHDWGGAVAWWSAFLFPERIDPESLGPLRALLFDLRDTGAARAGALVAAAGSRATAASSTVGS